MYSIDDVYKLAKYRLSKAGFNGNISPNDFNTVFPRAEKRYFSLLYRKYLQDHPNQDTLLPFKTDPIPITIDVDGKYTKPDNLLHVDAIRHTYNGIEVPVVRVLDDRLANNLYSTYDEPTAEFPIYVEYATYMQFYPKTLVSANLVYLSDFESSKWAYTLVGGRPVYDETNSVQPKWTDDDIDELIYMIGVDFGLNMKDQMGIQVNEAKSKEFQ